MERKHTLRSEAAANTLLASTRSTVVMGRTFLQPAPKRVVQAKPSIIARIFKKG